MLTVSIFQSIAPLSPKSTSTSLTSVFESSWMCFWKWYFLFYYSKTLGPVTQRISPLILPLNIWFCRLSPGFLWWPHYDSFTEETRHSNTLLQHHHFVWLWVGQHLTLISHFQTSSLFYCCCLFLVFAFQTEKDLMDCSTSHY